MEVEEDGDAMDLEEPSSPRLDMKDQHERPELPLEEQREAKRPEIDDGSKRDQQNLDWKPLMKVAQGNHDQQLGQHVLYSFDYTFHWIMTGAPKTYRISLPLHQWTPYIKRMLDYHTDKYDSQFMSLLSFMSTHTCYKDLVFSRIDTRWLHELHYDPERLGEALTKMRKLSSPDLHDTLFELFLVDHLDFEYRRFLEIYKRENDFSALPEEFEKEIYETFLTLALGGHSFNECFDFDYKLSFTLNPFVLASRRPFVAWYELVVKDCVSNAGRINQLFAFACHAGKQLPFEPHILTPALMEVIKCNINEYSNTLEMDPCVLLGEWRPIIPVLPF